MFKVKNILIVFIALMAISSVVQGASDKVCCQGDGNSSVGALPNEIADVEYPVEFVESGVSGEATVRVNIDETGNVTKAEMLSLVGNDGSEYLPEESDIPWLTALKESIEASALKSTFIPAQICGEFCAVQQLYTYTIKP